LIFNLRATITNLQPLRMAAADLGRGVDSGATREELVTLREELKRYTGETVRIDDSNITNR
jgi:hypothetical protein